MVPRKGEIKAKISENQKFYGYINIPLNTSELLNGISATENKYTFGFLDTISLQSFNRSDLINNDYFKRSLKTYLKNFVIPLDTMLNEKDSFSLKKNKIRAQLQGPVQYLAIIYLLKEYRAIGFGNDTHTKGLFLAEIEDFKNKELLPSYIKEIESLKNDLELSQTTIPKEVLIEKLRTSTGETITLEELIKRNNTKNTLLSFWSFNDNSTLSEMVNSKAYSDGLLQNNELSIIYISLDKTQDKWSSVVHNLGEYTSANQHYRIGKKSHSFILKYFFKLPDFKNHWIYVPKWSILDGDNSVFLMNAPNPKDSLVFKGLLHKIK